MENLNGKLIVVFVNVILIFAYAAVIGTQLATNFAVISAAVFATVLPMPAANVITVSTDWS